MRREFSPPWKGGRVLPDIQVRPWGSVTIPQVMTHQLFLCKPLRELGAASASWVRIPVVPRFSHLEYGNHSSTYLAEYCANKRHPGEPRLCPGWGPAWEPGRGPLRRAFARGPRTPACPAPPLCPPWLPRGLPGAPSGPPRPKSPRSPQARPGAALPAASTGPGALRPAAGRGWVRAAAWLPRRRARGEPRIGGGSGGSRSGEGWKRVGVEGSGVKGAGSWG